MAKKQTRRSISVSRSTYERLKAFCEANHVSMSQLVETRVNDFLGGDGVVAAEVVRPAAPRPPVPSPMPTPSVGPSAGSSFGAPMRPSMPAVPVKPVAAPPPPAPPPAPASVPMTSAAARSVVEPPPPIIKPKQETAAPKPAEKRPDQIFTF
jgi:hypothetical protein